MNLSVSVRHHPVSFSSPPPSPASHVSHLNFPPPTLPRQNVSTFGTLIDGKTWLLLDVMEKFHIIMAQGHQHSLC